MLQYWGRHSLGCAVHNCQDLPESFCNFLHTSGLYIQSYDYPLPLFWTLIRVDYFSCCFDFGTIALVLLSLPSSTIKYQFIALVEYFLC